MWRRTLKRNIVLLDEKGKYTNTDDMTGMRAAQAVKKEHKDYPSMMCI
jgi:hypothetical protein